MNDIGFSGDLPAKGSPAAIAGDVDLSAVFADALAGDFYRYDGSLTTPPCSETVNWFVMATPMTASAAQIAKFKAAFPDPMNNRPVQALNDRSVFKSATSADVKDDGEDSESSAVRCGALLTLFVSVFGTN